MATVVGASDRVDATPGPSNRENAVAGPKKKGKDNKGGG